EDGIRDKLVTGVQTCALPIWAPVVPVVGARRDHRRRGCDRAGCDCGGGRTQPRESAHVSGSFALLVTCSALLWDGVRAGCCPAEIGRASWRERVEISRVVGLV